MITRRAATAGLATALLGFPRPGWTQPKSGDGGGLIQDLPAELTARPSLKRLRADAAQETEVLTLGERLGPAFRLRAGAPLEFTFRNETSLPLSLHIQGLRGANAHDGVARVTQAPVPQGGTFTYREPPPAPGTFLIRPSIPGGSAEPLERGLSALLIVEEANPPPVDLDLPILIDDWRLGDDGRLAPFSKSADDNPAGRLGNFLTVNGDAVPQKLSLRPGSRLRLRLANACNARAMRLRFDNLRATVIAVDGQPTDTFEPLRSSLPIAPGSRYDLLVDLPVEADARSAVVAALGDGIPLVEFHTAGNGKTEPPPIASLAPNDKLPKAIALEKAVRKDLVIQTTGDKTVSGWTINGVAGDANAPVLKVKRGSPVVLTLINKTPVAQPLHLHGHVFRLLHALDDGWQPYFLDTIQVPENKTSRIAFIADNPGKWLLASTVMERFDSGLWTWIEVS
ncbi:multicopper oxidase family protein [Microvirga rosea]|uniref:multicopper oxidase family protein n=1 Tax=Microvirga rosea TaxID=2715425 RepID=UPI001D0B410B|nr:multicopper oxidase family protein [Microvirga rosea]MCB8820658.1 multicopper oxidase family protein [Microvirga rosea]